MAMRGSSYGGGQARSGNLLQQLYALSGRATLADLPSLYGQGGGLAGGGQEKGAAGFGGFEGAEPAAEGAGPGVGGGSYGSQGGLSSGGELIFPADSSGPNPSAYNPAYRRPYYEGGQGGTQGDPRLGASADATLSNIGKAAQFGFGLMSPEGVLGLGVQGVGSLLGLNESPLPEFTGEFNARDYLSTEELSAFTNEQNPTKKRQLAAQLQAKAQQRFNAERGAAGTRLGNSLVDQMADPAQTGFMGPEGPVGGLPAANRNALAGMVNGGRAGGGNMGGAGPGGNRGGGVGSSRADRADRAPGGPRGGPGI